MTASLHYALHGSWFAGQVSMVYSCPAAPWLLPMPPAEGLFDYLDLSPSWFSVLYGGRLGVLVGSVGQFFGTSFSTYLHFGLRVGESEQRKGLG